MEELYQDFISLRTYSRFRDELGRRETWPESVQRLIDWWCEQYPDHEKWFRETAQPAIEAKEVMPSMRSLQTAGKALDRDHVASFNCSYTPIDDPRCFDEIMYILLCGTGVGFSVERQYVSKLPEIPEEFHEVDTEIVVPDSKVGWASSFRQLVSLLYSGQVPRWNMDKIRPAGARLKTFGGRASGPQPLRDLFQFTVEMFRHAAGRQLSSLECHDLTCKIGDVVVVGGVRRSALISLSNLSDDRMRMAKSGQWWVDNPQRALANNSACYTEKPEFLVYLDEWRSLYESKSGERGIFSRRAARKQVERNGRRDSGFEWGTNPCSLSADTLIFTTEGPRRISDLEGKPFVSYVNGIPYRARKGSWISGHKNLYRLSTQEGFSLDLTDDHRLMTDSGWKMVREIEEGEQLHICNHDDLTWPGRGSEDEGYLIGMFVGDGNFSTSKSENGNDFGQLKVFRKDDGFSSLKKACGESALRIFKDRRSDWKLWCDYARSSYIMMNIGSLPITYGLSKENKHDISSLETTSSDFHVGFLRGVFDADGHFEGSRKSGFSIRLGQSDYNFMVSIQRMLARLGIYSRIYSLHGERMQSMPDGHGGMKDYRCRASWRLVVSGDSTRIFMDRVGFNHQPKQQKAQIVYEITHHQKKFRATFTGTSLLGQFPVWDAEVDDIVSFDANGFHAHNSEIILRPRGFCNLTEVIVRPDDSIDGLRRKVEIATILGTFQSSLTDFRYLRKEWRKNAEEERLLGVSLTGIMDHPRLSSYTQNEGDKNLSEVLNTLREHSIKVNKEWSEKIGINQSAAITCVKPSGTVSQLCNTASGIHPRFSDYYLRAVRTDKKDPLAHFMIDKGFIWEEDVYNNDNYVFFFPIKSPEDSLTADNVGAMDQLALWEVYQNHWCEHKPSMTCYYNDDEFLAIGNWVWNRFDKISGISFLPRSEHVYQQSPYQKITKEEYEEYLSQMPVDIDWTELVEYEGDDFTEGGQILACHGGSCEI